VPANSSASRSATADDCGAGLSRTALPKARAGAAFHNGIATGKTSRKCPTERAMVLM